MSHVFDRETGGVTRVVELRPYTLQLHTALRAIGATVLREGCDVWEAAERLEERLALEWAYKQFRRCLALGFADQPLEDQAMFLFMLATAAQQGDLN